MPDARSRVEYMRSLAAERTGQLRDAARIEEAERLAGTPLTAEQRNRAAEAYAALMDYFGIAHAWEAQYDDGHREAGVLDTAIEALAIAREDARYRDLAPDHSVAVALHSVRLLKERYDVEGDPADLRQASGLAEDAVGVARLAAPELLPRALRVLGDQLAARFDSDAHRELIDRAVSVLREACAIGAPAEDMGRLTVSLSAALLLRAKALGGIADLDEAVGILQRAAAEDPVAFVFDALGCVLIARAEQTESADDTQAAVEASERAVSLEPADPWFKASLATALRQRFTSHGDLRDDRRATQLLEQALREIPVGAPDRLRLLQNAAASSVSSLPLDDQIGMARELLEATPLSARSRPGRQGALATRLIERFQDTLEGPDLDEALTVIDSALQAADQGSVDRPDLLGHKAKALLLRYATGRGDESSLDQATGVAAEALKLAPYPERAKVALTLAQAWSLRGSKSAATEDLDQASAAFKLAAALGRARDPGTALQASRSWGVWAAEEGRWREAAEAFDIGLDAADDLYRRQVGRRDREAWLSLAPGLAADAASAAAVSGLDEQAILALERGRARMLSDALNRDGAEVGDVRAAGQAALADRFTRAAAELAACERSQDSAAAQNETAISAARTAFDAAVTAIRQVPGHELFLAPPTFAEITAAARAAACPVVYIASGLVGVVAAVRPNGEAAVRVLPELDEPTTRARVAAFIAAGRQRRQDPGSWQAELTRMTDWLGTAIWPAVLQTAGGSDRVVLVPLGLLGLLPLHAAARPDSATVTGRRYALDDVLISYTPNARALTASRAIAARAADASVLAVGAADHAGQEPLSYGDQEAAMVRGAFAAGHYVPAAKAALSEVRPALGQYDVLHFACHGRTDLFDPLAGGLLLAGTDALTLRDVLGLKLPDTRLAILSACDSAVAGVELPDEVVSLPSGLLQARCAGVIGSLWQVPDESTLLLMTIFVRQWRQYQTEPAQALRFAQQQVRDISNGDLQAIGAPGLTKPPADPRMAAVWASRRPYAHPQAWAAFTYTGA
jgi:CHAT domain-containing protein